MIKNFETNKELTKYISNKKIKILNKVTEGTCYLGEDNKVYKLLELDNVIISTYDYKEVITEDDIKLKSFAFPQELFVVDDKLVGYSSEYIPNDKFATENLNIVSVARLDFEKFSNAYKVMKKNVDTLSSKNILMYDLPFNILYDGKRLVGIDTCGYKKVDYDPTESNIKSYNFAIEGIFRLCYDDFEDQSLNFDDSDIDSYLKKVEDRLPNRAKLYRENIIKRRK